jgi:phage terminase small subunit
MSRGDRSVRAPRHLSREARRWFNSVVEAYNLEPHHLKLLQVAAECWDRSQSARKAIDRDGETVQDRFGQLRAHPLLHAERDGRTGFMRALRELDLDYEPDGPRPPPLRSNRRD